MERGASVSVSVRDIERARAGTRCGRGRAQARRRVQRRRSTHIVLLAGGAQVTGAGEAFAVMARVSARTASAAARRSRGAIA